MPTIYELSIGLNALEKRKTSVLTSNQNTIFPSCSAYSLVTTLTNQQFIWQSSCQWHRLYHISKPIFKNLLWVNKL